MPIFSPPGTFYAAGLIAVPFLFGFALDWMTAAGLIQRPVGIWNSVQPAVTKWFPLLIRVTLPILYLSFLAITSYIGHHFVTVRKMQIDEWLVNEAIESKLERLDKFHPKHFETHQEVSSWSMVVEPESFKVGLNASFTTEVDVNDEKYFTKVKKHILVPWLQVEIQKKEDTE